MRGPKPVPTKLKILHGNPGNRPLPEGEPEPATAIPTPPEHLGAVGLAEWNRIAPLLEQLDLVSHLDMAALAAYCVSYERWVEAENKVRKHGMIVMSPDKKFPMKSPYLSVAESAMEAMRKFLSEFGLSPASRVRLAKPSDGTGGQQVQARSRYGG